MLQFINIQKQIKNNRKSYKTNDHKPSPHPLQIVLVGDMGAAFHHDKVLSLIPDKIHLILLCISNDVRIYTITKLLVPKKTLN